MKFNFIQEPSLEFGQSIHICPRAGISQYYAYDIKFNVRRSEMLIGVVGTSEGNEKFASFMELCSSFIPAKLGAKQPNLFTSFCGVNIDTGFKSRFVVDNEITKTITNSEIKEIIQIENWEERINKAVDLYYENAKYLITEKAVDCVVIIIPKKLEEKITKPKLQPAEEKISDVKKEDDDLETDFRRFLKAKTMHLGKPIQLIKQDSLDPFREKSGKQDDATKAWNFCTALFYKTNHTPWRLIKDPQRPSTCFVGISFYRSRDRSTMNTSLAQLFDDLGNGVILRGSPVNIDKRDRQPHLNEEQSYNLIKSALYEYEKVVGTLPARLVIHKTSNYDEVELNGFAQAAQEFRINFIDYVTILDSDIRLFRGGLYPPYRGSHVELNENTHLLLTRGSVEYYKTYPGMYVPRPLEIRVVENDTPSKVICEEILALTKMNWNNTQFDGKYPITVACARKVGQIMKYMDSSDKPQTKYSFYM